MSWHKIFVGWITCLFLVPTVMGHETPPRVEDFAETVFTLNEIKVGVKIGFSGGTGFCLDPTCRFIATNYHVAMLVKPYRIKGQKVIERYLATGPDDDGATLNDSAVGDNPLKYTLKRDLAILELRHPISHHHGIPYSTRELLPGQAIEIYSYPQESLINPIRTLRRFKGTFEGETPAGLLSLSYETVDGRRIRPGASGGIVVDAKTHQIVGVLGQIATNGATVAYAVPTQSLMDFVTRVQPFLVHSLFPSSGVSSVDAEDRYPKFIPIPANGLQHRPAEPYEVSKLREAAELLSGSMNDFIAVQRLAWGKGNREPDFEAAYEVQILDGDQKFRPYPDGKKELELIPAPRLRDSVIPGVEWSELPRMVGTQYRLHINQAPSILVDGQWLKVFQFAASVEDAVCNFYYQYDFGFFRFRHTVTVPCYGEVWTDADTNILRISEHLELSKWEQYHVIVTYGWLNRSQDRPQLVPLTISANDEDHHIVHWCRGQFTDYRMFSSRVRIVADN
jgi:hypothetical protein